MKRTVLTINGKKDNDIELPNVFETEVNRTLIHRAFINLQTHGFQKHSTKPTAGMEVVADSNDHQLAEELQELPRSKEEEEDVQDKQEKLHQPEEDVKHTHQLLLK